MTDRHDALVRDNGPTYRSSGGLLLAAVERDEHDRPTFVPLDMGNGLTISVATDALNAVLHDCETPLRLPASYQDTIAICKLLGCIAPTAAISDAVWRAAAIHVPPKPLVFTVDDANRMDTVEWTMRHNVAIESALRGKTVATDGIIADVGKDWIIDNGLMVLGAVNYGWRVNAVHMEQPLGHKHNALHFDFSQVLRLVSRYATLNGEVVDMLDVLAPSINAKWLDPYR